MFARNVSFHLKSNMLTDYTRTFDKEILPLLRKQNGFKDEITFSGPSGARCDCHQSVGQQSQRRNLQHQFLSRGVEDDGKIYRRNAHGSHL